MSIYTRTHAHTRMHAYMDKVVVILANNEHAFPLKTHTHAKANAYEKPAHIHTHTFVYCACIHGPLCGRHLSIMVP